MIPFFRAERLEKTLGADKLSLSFNPARRCALLAFFGEDPFTTRLRQGVELQRGTLVLEKYPDMAEKYRNLRKITTASILGV
jgi:hypothetical protein